MRPCSGRLAVILGIAQSALAQSQADLSSAISSFPQLSTFGKLLGSNPQLIGSLIPTGTKGVTVLIPSDDAFAKYNGGNTTALSGSELVTVLQYHVMAANMTSQNFTADQGVIVPTMLRDEAHNNRTAGAALKSQYGDDAAQGQVIYAAKDASSSGKVRIKRATTKPQTLSGGLAQGAEMTLIDGQWSGGSFQIIDTVLIPPAMCSDTVRAAGSLGALDNALNRTNLWAEVNHINNITCLGPSNSAFSTAGNPDSTLDNAKLTEAILNHTISMPLYSTYLVDGMIIPSMGKMNITVTLQDGNIYFNDAMVIQPNVMTNNGLIHILDKVMSEHAIPRAPTQPSGSASGTATVTATATPSQTSNAANPRLRNAQGGLLAFVAAAAMML